jgi:hypothetical protein
VAAFIGAALCVWWRDSGTARLPSRLLASSRRLRIALHSREPAWVVETLTPEG